MSCGSCGSGGCATKGCNSNGGCASGGCNRLNTHNWLSDIPTPDFGSRFNIIEISFNKGSRKSFYKNTSSHYYEKGDFVTVEGTPGFDVGTISLTGELVKLQMAKHGVKENSDSILKILRPSTQEDLNALELNKPKERDYLVRARAMARQQNLAMKITEVELQADAKKATFYYIAEERVDFRELIKHYAYDFGVKVEMMQIGIRQEAAKVGGIGSCGRELCCSTWLSDFKGVSTIAARYQNLSINQAKLSGQCGRLKCCLNYELDTYMDALRGFPNDADKIQIASGTAFLQKKDIFKNLMWYSLSDSNKQYPLTIERVLEIKNLNKQGIRPEELGAEELEKVNKTEPQEAFVDVVGAFSLKTLEEKEKKNKQKAKQAQQKAKQAQSGDANAPSNKPNQGQNGGQQKQQGPRPNPNNRTDANKQGNANRPNENRPQGPRPNPSNKPQANKPVNTTPDANNAPDTNSNTTNAEGAASNKPKKQRFKPRKPGGNGPSPKPAE